MPTMDDVVLGLIEKTVEIAEHGKTEHSHSLYQIWDPLLRIYASCGADEEHLGRSLAVIDALVGLDAVGALFDRMRRSSLLAVRWQVSSSRSR
jgi:N-acyl-D-aspartate/D-glutamate deacylase